MAKNYRKIEKAYSTGEVIFTENSDCDGMYIIQSGQVVVYKTVQGKHGLQELELARIGAKGMFGEMAVIDEQRRSASVKAVEPTRVTIITRQMFNDQLQQLPTWVLTMIKLLVSRIRFTNEKLRRAMGEKPTGIGDTGGLFVVGESRKAAPAAKPAADGGLSQIFDETDQLLRDLDL